jgi:transcriptional regulator with XRE-family HTH domain
LARGLKQSQLATYAGVSRSYITRLERGAFAEPSFPKLSRIAGVLGCTLSDLTERLVTEETAAPRFLQDEGAAFLAALPYQVFVYNRVPGLHGGPGHAVPIQVVWLPAMPRKPGALIGLRVTGSCMSPDVQDGEIAILDMEASPLDGDIVAVETEDGGALRRYHIQGDSYVLTADNPSEDDEPIRLYSGSRMFPVVDVWKGRRPRRPRR